MSDTVLSARNGAVATVTLNRPECLNAMNPELVAAAASTLGAAMNDPEVHAIVLTGAGRAFCAGDDLREHRRPGSEAEARAQVEAIQEVTRVMLGGPKPVVGAIRGWAVGGGFEWAINCDLSVWGEGAKAFFPELSWGLFVTGAVTALLPRAVGEVKAREMLYLGERYGARDLLAAGLAWKVVPDDEVLAAAREAAERIAALPSRAVADMKRALAAAPGADLERVLGVETEATVRGFLDPESERLIAGFGPG